MTTKEIKEYFRQIRREQFEINHLTEMIKNEELSLLPSAIRYDKEKVQTSPEDVLSKRVAKITELETEYASSLATLKLNKVRAEAMLRSLDNSDEREVMRWYYMSFNDRHPFTWDEVAVKMSYTKRWILKLHGNAIMHLSESKSSS